MRDYETMVIIDPEFEDDTRDETIKKLEAAITRKNGTMQSIDTWGRKQLSYEVAGNTYGYYYILNYQGTAETVQEVERVIKITDGIPKFITVRRKKPVVSKKTPEKILEPKVSEAD